MNWSAIFTVYRKELRDALRDKRTLVSMFVIPTVIIPFIMFGFALTSAKLVKKAQAESPTIMLVGGADSPGLRSTLERSGKFQLTAPAADFHQQISDRRLRAAVEIPPRFDESVAQGQPAEVKIYVHGGEMRSSFASGEIERCLRDYREQVLRERLSRNGLPPDFARPFSIQKENVAPPEKVGGASFGGLIPYLLIILSFTGAMYPAIDLTAGEKERGTLETLLTSPVARIDLVAGKFLLILTTSIASVTCSLASLGATAAISSKLMQNVVSGGATIPPVSVGSTLCVFLMVLPLAVFFSALLFIVGICARTMKEAQSYTTPLLLVAMLPAISAVLPGVELTNALSFVPVLNVALVSKELMAGAMPWIKVICIFVSTCLYAFIALKIAARIFCHERIVFRM